MKQLQEMNVKSLSDHIMINEAWGIRKNYDRELKTMLDTYKKRDDSYKEKVEKAKSKGRSLWQSNNAHAVFTKYPIAILIDKMGYEPDMKRGHGPNGKYRPNTQHSARFIVRSLNDGTVTPEELAKWWEEYDTKINKEKYFDPDWIIKHIDPFKLWDPYHPDSTYTIDKLIENPAEVVNALNSYYGFKNKKTGNSMLSTLTQAEKEEVIKFYTEPTNQEMLHKLFLKAKNKFMKARPTLSQSVKLWLTDLFQDDTIDYDGCDLQRALKKEREESNRSYYQGSNYRSEEAHAIISVVTRALNEYYKLNIEYGNSRTEDEEVQRKFLKDAEMGIHIEVHRGKSRDTEHSSVVSSSFFTYYKYDIEVKIKVYKGGTGDNKYDTVFEKTYEGVTLGTDYYSGGWN